MKALARGLFGLCLACLVDCQSIAGIDDRTYDLGKAASADCVAYCQNVLKNCTGTNAVYSTMETCLGVCKLLPAGDPLEPAGNTLACRAQQALQAGNATAGEPSQYCPAAGPGGNGVCGDNCEGYCLLEQQACPKEFGFVTPCKDKCVALKDTHSFDVVANHEGDTLQCRLVHVSSATVDPVQHCAHSQFRPTEPWCVEKDPPNCDDYCRVELAACTGDLTQYENAAQCQAVCAVLPPGKHTDQTVETDTVGCRTYHSYSSLADAVTHCSHSGPGGDGHCGTDNCTSFCLIAQAACATQFNGKFDDLEACKSDCRTLSGSKADSKYSVTQSPQTALGCRMLHAVRGLAAPDTRGAECTSVFGGGSCP